MIEGLKAPVLRMLRVPAEPAPPAGSAESVRTFRASRKFYYLMLIRWCIVHLATLAGFVVFLGMDFSSHLGKASLPVRIIETVAVALFFLQLPFSFLLVRFDYDLRWYIVTDRSLRIRYGLFLVREMTMAFANIQQITLRQGPLQRLLGIADLEVRTAGGGSTQGDTGQGDRRGGPSGHLGFFHGVENAAEIRDLILARLRHWRDAGLGDPDGARITELAASVKSSTEGNLVRAAQLALSEAKALRAAICSDQ